MLSALRAAEAYLMQLTALRVMHDLRAMLFRHLLRLEAAFFDRNPVGRLMTRVLNDVEAVSEAFTSGLFAVVGDVITLAGVGAGMLLVGLRPGPGALSPGAPPRATPRLLPNPAPRASPPGPPRP